SITTSMPGAAIIAAASSVMNVPPRFAASSIERAAYCSAGQPTRASASRARAGARSAMPATLRPGVRRACARNIEPNLPAPIRPTRTGFPASARALSLVARFITAPAPSPSRCAGPSLSRKGEELSDSVSPLSPGGRGSGVRGLSTRALRHRPPLQEAVVGQHVDRREVAVGDPGLALEAADGVVAAIEREIDDPARPWRQVGARGVHEIAVEQQRRAGRALGRDDAALFDEPRDRRVVDRPQRIARGGHVMPGFEPSQAMALRDE